MSPAPPPETAMPMEHAKAVVLIVDDIESNIDILLHTLAQDYDVSVAMDGETALRAAIDLTPELILLDIMMPGMDGYEVCRRLKASKQTRDIPVVFLSALSEDAAEEKGLNLGAIDYITKPFTPALVRARIANHLCLSRTQRQNSLQRQQLDESYGKLLQLEKQRNDLVHMLIHDMRSPLMAISGNLELALDTLTGSPGSPLWQNVRDAFANTKILTEMITSVLDVSRLEAGQMPLHQRLCDLLDLTRKALHRVAGLAPARTVGIDCEGDAIQAFCDPEIIERVIINLVSNAVTFTPPDSQISVAIKRGTGWNAISVTDTGPGIAPEFHGKVFEKFGQVEIRNEGRRMSTGLGLTFCKLAVEAHGGTIRLESEPGHGATFHIWLPTVTQTAQ